MTKNQANQHRLTMAAALNEASAEYTVSLGCAAVRCCLGTALAYCKALADGGMLEQSDEWAVNETKMALAAQGVAV